MVSLCVSYPTLAGSTRIGSATEPGEPACFLPYGRPDLRRENRGRAGRLTLTPSAAAQLASGMADDGAESDASSYVEEPWEFEWRLRSLCEDGKYSDALQLLQASDRSLKPREGSLRSEEPLERLCMWCDAKGTEAELRLPLIKAFIDKGADPHNLPYGPFQSAFENTDIQVVRFLIHTCGARMRGKDASKLIEHAQRYIRGVRENGPPWPH